MARTRDTRTLDLLSWEPPAPPPSPALRYEQPDAIRAASMRSQFLRGMKLAEEDSGLGREQIAEAMAAYLGEDVSKSVLDQYMSESRADYTINVIRFLAFIHATKDYRLLSLLAEPFGLAIIEKRWLGAVEEARLAKDMEALEQQRRDARRRWTTGGGR